MNKKKILIIGSTSGIAIELIFQLKKRFSIFQISRKKVDAIKNLEKYENYILKIKPDLVINCVVANGIDFCQNNPHEAYLLNTVLPVFIGNICENINSKFIHFSTEAVFLGNIKDLLYDEKSKPNPTTLYGKSKYLADLALSKMSNALILRIPMLFGPSHKRQLITKLVIKLINNEKIRVAKDVFTTPLYIPGLVKLVINIIQDEKKYFFKNSQKIINLSSNSYISLYNLMKKYAKILNKEKKIIPVNDVYFNGASIKPRYLGLKSLKKNTIRDNLDTCIKDHVSNVVKNLNN